MVIFIMDFVLKNKRVAMVIFLIPVVILALTIVGVTAGTDSDIDEVKIEKAIK